MKIPHLLRAFKSSKRDRPVLPANKTSERDSKPASLDMTDELGRPDYLGKAAMAGHAARDAVKSGDHDKAWVMLHEQKSFYALHAQKSGWKAQDVLRIDGSISEELANILRLEKKHDQALVHILYWIATSITPIKRHKSKLNAHLNRCKFEGVSLQDAEDFIGSLASLPEYTAIQSQVAQWRKT